MLFIFALFCFGFFWVVCLFVCCFGVTPSSNDFPYGVQNSLPFIHSGPSIHTQES